MTKETEVPTRAHTDTSGAFAPLRTTKAARAGAAAVSGGFAVCAICRARLTTDRRVALVVRVARAVRLSGPQGVSLWKLRRQVKARRDVVLSAANSLVRDGRISWHEPTRHFFAEQPLSLAALDDGQDQNGVVQKVDADGE